MKNLTENEKKEFEEFLKWKEEKAKLAASTDTEKSSEIPVDEDANEEKDVVLQTDTVPNSDSDKDSSNTSLYVFAAVLAISLVLLLILALSANKQNTLSGNYATANVEVDSVEVLTDNEEIAPTNDKALWNFTIVKDDMYDSNNIWAEIKSDNYITQDFPYEGYTYAKINVRSLVSLNIC